MMKRLPEPTADTPSYDEIRASLARLEAGTTPGWGKLTSPGMCRHCRQFVELYLGEIKVALPMRLLMRAVGGIFLKKVLSGSPRDTPKNIRTLGSIRVTDESLDFEAERTAVLAALARIEALSGIVEHPVYGTMHADDVHALVRHHTAHHLHQFGVL